MIRLETKPLAWTLSERASHLGLLLVWVLWISGGCVPQSTPQHASPKQSQAGVPSQGGTDPAEEHPPQADEAIEEHKVDVRREGDEPTRTFRGVLRRTRFVNPDEVVLYEGYVLSAADEEHLVSGPGLDRALRAGWLEKNVKIVGVMSPGHPLAQFDPSRIYVVHSELDEDASSPSELPSQ